MRRPRRIGRALVGAFLLFVAIWILREALREYHFHEIVAAVRAIPAARVALSLVLTGLGYLALVGYDVIALRVLGRRIGIGTILPVSFIGYAVSNSAPVSLLTGGGLRYRLFGSVGLTALETAKVVAFDVSTYLAGLFTVGGIAFLAEPLAVPGSLHLPFTTVHPLGSLFLGLAGAYLALTAARRRPLRIGRWTIPIPSTRVALAQIGVSSLDWLLSGAVLYVLLPAGAWIGYPAFLAIFLVAQLAALLSPLPGGLGLFEAIVVALMPPGTPVPGVIGALLAYRVVYYLLPLLLAAALLGVRLLHARLGPRRH